MEYAQFIESVRQRADLSSQQEAESVVEAVLETLGERVERTERNNLAAQLSRDLARLLKSGGKLGATTWKSSATWWEPGPVRYPPIRGRSADAGTRV
jgi:uncharacterized protein (DUF2267 family)